MSNLDLVVQPHLARSEQAGPTPAPQTLQLLVDRRISRDSPTAGRLVPVLCAPQVHLSWRPFPAEGEFGQTAYEVSVNDSFSGTVWSSGIVHSSDRDLSCDLTLLPNSQYEWSVRIADRNGEWSPWARDLFETGPFTIDDWTAQWLEVPALQCLRTPFDLPSAIRRARLHLTGQGLVRSWINDEGVNDDSIDPTRTDFVRALYRSYEVTDLVQPGPNSLDFVVGLGEWKRTELPPRLLAELVVWLDDGTVVRIAPGEGTRVAPSEVTAEDPFYLEQHDRTGSAGSTGVTSTAALSATAVLLPADVPASPDQPPRQVAPDPTPALTTVREFIPVEIRRSGGVRLYDVGTNIAGRSSLTIHSAVPAGTAVRISHGEHVDDRMRLDTTNLNMPFDHGRSRQVLELVASGRPDETVEAWFAYYGFRYIEVRGLPDDAAVTLTARSLHSDLRPSIAIETDNHLVDTVMTMASRTFLNNVHGVPEDCPTREQAAWTGDTASVAEYELAAFDSSAFLAKWIDDLITSQQADGSIPAVAPDLHTVRMPADPVWGAAFHRVLLGHWRHYGDVGLVHRALPALRRWADYQLGCADSAGIISESPISYGHDWLGLEQTTPPVHHTGATIDCLQTLADLEQDAGFGQNAAVRREQAARLRGAARAFFYDESRGVFADGSQAAYAVAIDSGILLGHEAQRAADRIVESIRQRGNRLSSGFAATRTVVRALTAMGRSQTLLDVLSQQDEPGVGAMLASGPGTFWECWWIDPQNTGTGSLDHIGLGGTFAAWAIYGLAGISPTAAGYREFRLAPQFVRGVDRLRVVQNTPVGDVVVDYALEPASTAGGSDAAVDVTLTVTVPSGSRCTLLLTESDGPRMLEPGSHRVSARVELPVAYEAGAERVPWTAPSTAPAAADVTGPSLFELPAIAERVSPGAGAPVVDVVPRLNCMPIPHAQLAGPVIRVAPTETGSRMVSTVLKLEKPLNLRDRRFVYALVDQCSEGNERTSRPLIRVRSATGSMVESIGTSWPAGWNRVAVDIDGWRDRDCVTAVEVGILFDGPAPDGEAFDAVAGGGFHLGEIGASTAPRTW